jgi:hypothetical protein
MISIETTTKLLKLHLKWQDRKSFKGNDDEAHEFFKWLFVNHFDRPEVLELDNDETVEEFLANNKHVLWPTSKEEKKWATLRLEPRIENDVKVKLMVVASDDPDFVGSTLTGRTLDIGLHGIRMTITEQLPAGALLQLDLTKDDSEAVAYRLNGELRWSAELAEEFLIGIKLAEDEAHEIWREIFGAEFVAPVLGKSKGSN